MDACWVAEAGTPVGWGVRRYTMDWLYAARRGVDTKTIWTIWDQAWSAGAQRTSVLSVVSRGNRPDSVTTGDLEVCGPLTRRFRSAGDIGSGMAVCDYKPIATHIIQYLVYRPVTKWCWGISHYISVSGYLRAVRQRSDYKISAMKRYEPLRFLAGRKSTLALYVNNNSHAHRQKLVAV